MHETQPTKGTEGLRIRRSEDRGLQDLGWSENRMTFSFADYYDPDWMRFGPLRVLIESRIQSHSGFSKHPHRHVDIVSYVTSGVLRHQDSFGHEADISEGEMQLISAGRRGMIHSEENPFDETERHYQLWFIPDHEDTNFSYHELGFSPDERQGQFRLYVSPDGDGDSMPINTDAYVYAGLFAPNDTHSYLLRPKRGVWVQVVRGSVDVGDVTLQTGDGVGITHTGPLHFSFEEASELLLIDVRMDAPRIWE